MITDALLQLSDAQAVTASAYSTNTIDLQGQGDIGAGSSLFLVFGVWESAAGSAVSVTFQVVASAAAGLSPHTVLVQSGPIALSALSRGRKLISLEVPRGIFLHGTHRYLGARFEVAGGVLSSGRFDCILTPESPPHADLYPSGWTVY